MNSLEAKVVILGAQGAGKTSLVVRFVENNFHRNEQSTIGASFLVKKVYHDPANSPFKTGVNEGTDKSMIVWCGYRFGILPDRNGFGRWYVPVLYVGLMGEAPMYYRGANAAIICYDITSAASWSMVDTWLQELRRNMTTKLSSPPHSTPFGNFSGTDLGVVHLVGGKLDLAMANPALRAVPFEEACAYAEENLDDMQGEQPVGDDLSCHEVSAKDDTGVEEVFLAISRRLVEQREEIEDARDALTYGRRQYTSVHPEDTPRPRGGCPC